MEMDKNNMNIYTYRGAWGSLASWRKKRRTTFLMIAVLLLLIVFILQFYMMDQRGQISSVHNDKEDDAFLQSIKVKFIEAAKLNKEDEDNKREITVDRIDGDLERLKHLEQPSRDDIAKRQTQKSVEVYSEREHIDILLIYLTFLAFETEQQLGIPYINYELKKPYIPKQRIVHFDLKGAPPTISYMKKIISLSKNVGATGVLLEYEDMFPYTGILKPLSAKNAYTVEEVKDILKFAEDLQLEIIPLIQTFGHLEFALKHKEFSHIREVPGSPQALCPSRNSSLDLVRELVNQIRGGASDHTNSSAHGDNFYYDFKSADLTLLNVCLSQVNWDEILLSHSANDMIINMHPTSKYLHIGCDEVFEMGECELCRTELHENLFLKHVQNVANIVYEKNPKIQVIIWDDMLRHISLQSLQSSNLGDLVEPMVWVYAEDIYRFVQPPVWDKYALAFKTAWTASAFKGAFGETLYIPNARRHLENNLRWLEVMSTQSSAFKHGMRGIVLTGWQRYDHFAVLCELLPAAIPSLVLNLLATTNGFFNATQKEQFMSTLSCPRQNDRRPTPFLALDTDPNMWEKLSRCMFPGNGFFKLIYRLHNAENEAKEYIDSTTRQKGWMTAYNAKYNYSSPLRVDELTQDLPRVYHGMVTLARNAADSLAGIVDNYTISEWIEERIYPYLAELEKIQNQSVALKNVKYWPSRPLPMLKDLQRHGIAIG